MFWGSCRMVCAVWRAGGGDPGCAVCAGPDQQGVFDESGRCGGWIFFVGNGQGWPHGGDAVRCAAGGPGCELASAAGRAGSDDESGLAGAVAHCKSAGPIKKFGLNPFQELKRVR